MSNQPAQKIICPQCGAEMNHHAMKIDYSVGDSTGDDSVFGGALQEVHTCPNCGHIELRRTK